MPAFGDYQSVDEIGLGDDSTVFSAISLSRQRNKKFAVKVRRFPDAELNAAAVESVRVQKAAVDFGGKHLAPIFDSGITEDDRTWYVTRHYDSSLAAFLKARGAADSTLLYRITDHILSGLEEFFHANQRPHGNLKPGNVLLEGSDYSTLRAILADPAAEVDEIDSSQDLFSVGLIVYQLVRQSARVQVINPPLELTHEWNEFGQPWLDFTNRLLARSANGGSNAIGEARGHLRKLRKVAPAVLPDPRERVGGFWKLAAAVVILSGIGGATKYYIDTIRAARDVPRIIETTPEEMKLAQAVLALCENPPAVLSRDSHLESAFKKLGNAEPNRKLLNDFSAAISADKWPAKKAVNEAYRRYSEADWPGLCRALNNARGDFDVRQPPAPQLIVTAEAASSVDRIDAEWQPVKKFFDSWADAHETDLLAFKEWADAEMKTQEDLLAAPEKIRDIRSQLETVSTRTSADDWKTRFRQARFHADAKIADKRLSPKEWLAEAENYWREEDPTILTNWKNQKTDLDTALSADQRKKEAKALSDLERRLEDPVVSDAPSIKDLFAKLSTHTKPTPTPPVTLPTTTPIPKTEVVMPIPVPKVDLELIKLQNWLADILTAANANPKTTAQDFLPTFEKLATLAQVSQDKVESLRKELKDSVKSKALPAPALGDAWDVGAPVAAANAHVYSACRHKASKYGMPFILVQTSNGQPFYMGAIEVPLGMVQALGQLPTSNAMQERGPQVWGKPNQAWEWKQAVLKPMSNLFKNGPVDFYAPGIKPPPPSTGTPLNGITGKQASHIAEVLQCAVPSYEQWQAAGTYAAPLAPRLRGSMWLKQFTYWKELRSRFIATGAASTYSIPWMDDGSYTFQNGQWERGDTPEIAQQADNSSLWFRSVAVADPRSGYIYDLLGNVAEFILDNGRFSVIGGSAISDPKLADKPQEVRAPNDATAFSDVGVRLVVKASAPQQEDELAAFRKDLQAQLDGVSRQLSAAP